MYMKKKKLQVSYKKYLKFFQGFLETVGTGATPRKDWNIALFFFGALLFVFIFIAALSFFSTEQIKNLREDSSSQVMTIDRGELKEVLEQYSTKELLYEERKRKVPSVVDPAL